MRKILFTLLVAVVMNLPATAFIPIERFVIKIDSAAFDTLVGRVVDGKTWVAANSVPTVVDFNATWCGPCQQMEPILHLLVNKYNLVNFYSIDVDENRPLAKQLGVTNIPLLLLCPEDGEPTAIVGFHDFDEMSKIIEQTLGPLEKVRRPQAPPILPAERP